MTEPEYTHTRDIVSEDDPNLTDIKDPDVIGGIVQHQLCDFYEYTFRKDRKNPNDPYSFIELEWSREEPDGTRWYRCEVRVGKVEDITGEED